MFFQIRTLFNDNAAFGSGKATFKSFIFGLKHPSRAAAAVGAFQGAYEGPWGGVPETYDRADEAQKAAVRKGAPSGFNPNAGFAGAIVGMASGATVVYKILKTLRLG